MSEEACSRRPATFLSSVDPQVARGWCDVRETPHQVVASHPQTQTPHHLAAVDGGVSNDLSATDPRRVVNRLAEEVLSKRGLQR